MSDTVRLYLGKDIEITYDTERCIHAAECTRGLPVVFDNSRRPWIQPDSASANTIAAVIARCPSGALQRMVGARGFEPPTPWSRTRFDTLLKLVEFCCFELIQDELFAALC